MSSQNIEESTTALVTEAAPDNKTRRYDRQLRLWAASGQAALESSRILVISGTATSTSILKNLVLPGIGHFTILDPLKVTPEDAGNNFFLEGPSSIGKSRAEEAVRLLGELNDGVEGKADLRSIEEVLEKDKTWLLKFTIVIAHNLEAGVLDRLATLLWEDESNPPLLVVRSAGFLAEFYIQYHEHTVIESHPETPQSLLIDKPFPALLDYAMKLDFENMDVTDHAHIPYVVILVRLLEEWKKTHDGSPPSTYEEKKVFKKSILAMQKKSDEENFEEAEAQAYRTWTKTTVPSETSKLFSDPKVLSLSPTSPPFFHLVHALKRFTDEQPGQGLPLTSTLPDMKASTGSYIHLQKLYKTRAEEEKAVFKNYLQVPVDDDMVDTFLKNSHALKLLRGKKWGSLDADPKALVTATETAPKQLATHLALTALSALATKHQPNAPLTPTVEALTAEAQALLPPDTDLPEDFENSVGEVVRSPTADLPNTAALLGGVVAQEVIKMITKQYIPINGSCIIDLIETWTGIL
ncbi:hypothetical protein GALMADRAFT_254985 [Galerina marginata CBS 339.88]|uniref:NEDD8-activating enzyme E1 regulatory subunit n=1 Tax=Galerina marginata (strain CBS 339.88) TaxID=685588 RepID=A0A067STQ5_GALM3|nr:hypothetical protein GALMADRAFT_254985 [Galerina marginata CBS 339.88]